VISASVKIHPVFLHLYILKQYYSGDQIKKNEMGGAWGTCGGEERCMQGFDVET
jgi:hypothetical protein